MQDLALDEPVWDALGVHLGTPALVNIGLLECDLCLLAYHTSEEAASADAAGGRCPASEGGANSADYTYRCVASASTHRTSRSVRNPRPSRPSWFRFNTESNFNADAGGGLLPAGFTESPHKPQAASGGGPSIAFFPRLEFCCRRC
jgi:hypothetical protein